MAKQKSLSDYEERYRRVFAAGARNWNDPRPNPHLSLLLDRLPVNSRCIEFGCGEGYQSYLMASRGHSVTGIDFSETAVGRAIKNTPEGLSIDFIAGDVTEPSPLQLDYGSYDLAVDIGCLHMMTDNEDRGNYLRFARALLKKEGLFFLMEGLDIEDITPGSEDEAERIAAIKKDSKEAEEARKAGISLPRSIITPEGPKEVSLALCPARMLPLKRYEEELESYGFRILSSERVTGTNACYEALLITEKV